jgi:3'-phosphoadenosine 5'-phosphosulfate sulfotransferase (PAPS reductase)/FAD synthetase
MPGLDLAHLQSAFERHQRIAFQFSGGRDSTAALYLLRPLWSRLTVYHLDTGDQFPETRAVVDAVAREVDIVLVQGDVAGVRREFGLPSDIVPVDNTDIGRMVSGRAVKLQSRYDCCIRSLMAPMHRRMREDGITLLVRGQRDDEYAAPPHRSGQSADGFEVLYPIQHWTGEQVSAYLKDNGLPLAQFYERGARRAPECMGCTAWWDEGRAAYMREHHPAAFDSYRANMKTIRIEIDRQYAMLDD